MKRLALLALVFVFVACQTTTTSTPTATQSNARSAQLPTTVIDYERAHKNRAEVLQTATHRLVMHAD